MTHGVFWLLIGMMLVTYIPRALPAVVVDKLKFSPRVEKFLSLIPYTAMTALIFPGVLTFDPAAPQIGVLAAALAMLLAWRKCSVLVVVVVSVLAVMAMYLIV